MPCSETLEGMIHAPRTVGSKRPVGLSWRRDETYIKVVASGSTFTARLIALGTPSIFCSQPSAIRQLLGVFWNAPLTCTKCLTRSPSTRAAPTRPPLKVSRLKPVSISRYTRTNTSTTSSNRITEPSNESQDRCSGSNRFGVLEFSSPASRPCT